MSASNDHYDDRCTCPNCCLFRVHPQLPRPKKTPTDRQLRRDVDKLECGDVAVLYDRLPNNVGLDVLHGIKPDEAIEGGTTPAVWHNDQDFLAHRHADRRATDGRFAVVQVIAIYENKPK